MKSIIALIVALGFAFATADNAHADIYNPACYTTTSGRLLTAHCPSGTSDPSYPDLFRARTYCKNTTTGSITGPFYGPFQQEGVVTSSIACPSGTVLWSIGINFWWA